MRIDLAGRRALVTGSTRGIGYAIAKGLSEAGALVHVNGRSAEAVERALASQGQKSYQRHEPDHHFCLAFGLSILD